MLTGVLNSMRSRRTRRPVLHDRDFTGRVVADACPHPVDRQGGDGGDGWAVDFLTVGVTTTPEPSAILLAGLGILGLLRTRRPKNS